VSANDTAIGTFATASGGNSLATGVNSSASGTNAYASGVDALASGNNSSAIGTSALASNTNTQAFGTGAQATAVNASASGAGARADGLNSVAVGAGSWAQAQDSFAAGTQAVTRGASALAIGNQASGTGLSSISIGESSTATNTNATAFGTRASATAVNSAAYGAGASSAYANSTAIGAGAFTSRPDQISIGTRGQSYQMPGLSNNGNFVGKAYQSGSTRAITTDAQGNLGTSSYDLDKGFKGLGAGINSMGAMTGAMSALPTYVGSQDEWGRCGVSGGGTGGVGAAAFGCAVRIGDRVHLNGAMAIGPSQDYDAGSTSPLTGRIGVSFPLGIIHKTKPTTVAVLPNGESVAKAIGERDQQITMLTKQIGELQSRINGLTPIAANEKPNAATDALVRDLQAQVQALREKLAATSGVTSTNAQLLDRIKELEAQMGQLRRASLAQPGSLSASSTSMQSLEQRINEQDTLIKTLMQRLKSVTTFAAPELKTPAASSPAPQPPAARMSPFNPSATSRSLPPVQPSTASFPEQSSLLP
jgi:hypothetical protein